MATWEDVRRIAGALPEVVETNGSWRVRGKPVAWERPLRRSDYEALGEAAPEGPILGVRTPDVGVKEALISDAPDVFFTTPPSTAIRPCSSTSTRRRWRTWKR